jgi:hypothetical protein
MKVVGVRRVVDQLERYGFTGRVRLIGAGEVVSALAFVVPQTRPLGLLLVSALLGGAIATHMQHRLSFIGPSVFLGVIWLATWLCDSDLLWQLAGAR